MAWNGSVTVVTQTLASAGDFNDLSENVDYLLSPSSFLVEYHPGSNYTISATVPTDLDATNVTGQITTNGGDIMIGFDFNHSVVSTATLFAQVEVDGPPSPTTHLYKFSNIVATGQNMNGTISIPGLVADTYTITLQVWRATANCLVYGAAASEKITLWAKER
jgi:hypothetical protein